MIPHSRHFIVVFARYRAVTAGFTGGEQASQEISGWSALSIAHFHKLIVVPARFHAVTIFTGTTEGEPASQEISEQEGGILQSRIGFESRVPWRTLKNLKAMTHWRIVPNIYWRLDRKSLRTYREARARWRTVNGEISGCFGRVSVDWCRRLWFEILVALVSNVPIGGYGKGKV